MCPPRPLRPPSWRRPRGHQSAVWLHGAGRKHRAALHTIKRHGGRVEGVVILEIAVPRCWPRRSKRGLWYCPRDIPPGRVRGVVTFAALARSPVSGDAA